MSNPKVFLSYSWDTEEHKTWVRELAERLIANGVDAKLDQWHVLPGQSLTQFMEKEANEADYILIVCTPNYCSKSTSRSGGVGYEQQIISGQLVGGIERERFIPIVRNGDFEPSENCAIPMHFRGIYAVDMRDDEKFDGAIETLLRAIYKEPLHKAPVLGSKPDFSNGSLSSSRQSFDELRLATLDLDGYHLLSGLAQHHRTPDTFYMPPEKDRRELKEGDIVKLPFEISVPEDEEWGDISPERMWVQVTGNAGPYYIGRLDNVPACSDEQDHLNVDDEVIFLPEHVIQIYDET
ncbi:toll/interleukin-1 receptor domain-containing protein [Vibrio parahaemolyticus]|uniref:toll/interleukin-1 receptor domain-containing protein n=1 Tax=Vibrio parahaemolyticus TaxID=670 RepID=UPI0004119A3B|nr:toll/interleukin-1 receptor domain-containing protein [Vibrio parahaemolyticus]EJG0989859.1 toll/interleukin-1 receptor domain-containing protein [Vibrio parahaemolyticus]EJG1071823.1 toll/interleukin-1 receptor domain-containing protein [Vibrio parahaemolyticus]ELA8132720.1 toll/interleukin-1 receptor domain-containing protein [Vibrio parahaemolyticus]TOK49815.1 hypothetical protein CGI17_24915 [Vibrio parahaemolyticus]TOK79525.1 hypothetical protein CGI11_17045 [Vibrio parahaemolyticus]